MKLKSLLLLIMTAVLLLSGCATTESDVPQGMQLLSNEHVNYTAYIDNSWQVTPATEATATPYAYVGSGDKSNVSIVASTLTAEQMEMTLDEIWESYSKDFMANMPDMTYVGDYPITTTLDGIPANQYVYTATVANILYKYQQTICVYEGDLFIITYTSTPELYNGEGNKNIDAVEKLLKTFKF